METCAHDGLRGDAGWCYLCTKLAGLNGQRDELFPARPGLVRRRDRMAFTRPRMAFAIPATGRPFGSRRCSGSRSLARAGALSSVVGSADGLPGLMGVLARDVAERRLRLPSKVPKIAFRMCQTLLSCRAIG